MLKQPAPPAKAPEPKAAPPPKPEPKRVPQRDGLAKYARTIRDRAR